MVRALGAESLEEVVGWVFVHPTTPTLLTLPAARPEEVPGCCPKLSHPTFKECKLEQRFLNWVSLPLRGHLTVSTFGCQNAEGLGVDGGRAKDTVKHRAPTTVHEPAPNINIAKAEKP